MPQRDHHRPPLAGSAEYADLPLQRARERFLAAFQQVYLRAQLRRYNGSIKKTARHAGITDRQLRALLKRHRIHVRDFLPPSRPQPTVRSRPARADV